MPYGGRGDPVSVSRVISAMVSTRTSLSAMTCLPPASHLPCPLLLPFLISPGTQPCPALAKGIVGGVSLPLFSSPGPTLPFLASVPALVECRAKPKTWHTQDSHYCVRSGSGGVGSGGGGQMSLGGLGGAQVG